MTVESLDTARAVVAEDPVGVAAVYEYHHAVTGKRLYSVEHPVNRGATEASGYVLSPRLIYTKEGGWSE
jgi:hypothetical protein